jgi:two-component system, OmpR family, phosphate regulon sensor histidine kinase PhoR
MRREFVANVSHELRTPISVILANAETLMDEGCDICDSHPLMEALHRHSIRLSVTIKELLDLSRLDAGAYIPDIQMIHLESELSNHIEVVCFSNEQTRTITTDIPFDLQMAADRHALTRIISNLLGNALKYTPPDSQIMVRAARMGELVQIEVEDNGPGIEPQEQELIFQRFHRVSQNHSRSKGGSGLGLAIVKSYLKEMGGQISCRSAHPHGAIFQITLPAIPDA